MTIDSVPGKILVVKPSSLGDVIQALPVATGLKKWWPSTTIHWVLNESYQELLIDHPAIDRLVLYPRHRWKGWSSWPEMGAWSRELRSAQYDVVLDLQGLLRSGWMTWVTRAPRRVGLASAREGAHLAYNETVADTATSAAQRYWMALDYLIGNQQKPTSTVIDESYNPNPLLKQPLDPLDFGWAHPPRPTHPFLQKPYLVIHPYSRWRTKLWPFRFYHELVELLPEKNVVFLGQGPWFPLPQERCLDWRHQLGFQELKAVLAHASMVLSTDSGPAHLAASLGTPTHVLFGPTDWQKTKPVGRFVTFQASKLSCSPCLKRTCAYHDRLACLREITPQSVACSLVEGKKEE